MENPIELFNAFLGVLEKVSQISENLKGLQSLENLTTEDIFKEAEKYRIKLGVFIEIAPKEEGKEKDE